MQDASIEDASEPPDVGVNAPLTSAAQVVPLLFGREVTLVRWRDGVPRKARVGLSDVTDMQRQAFFADLNAACLAELALPDDDEPSTPGCARDAATRAALAACRASTALDISNLKSPDATVIGRDGDQLRVGHQRASKLPPHWSRGFDDTGDSASWAMLAVTEWREAIAILAPTFESAECSSHWQDEWSADESLAMRAAQTLVAAVDELPAATERADALLHEQLTTAQAPGPLGTTARIQRTRGLNLSLLERMRLYAGIPYGAYEPLPDGETPRATRFPVAPDAPDATIAKAAVLLATSNTEVLTASGDLPMESDLLKSWLDALHAEQPLTFDAFSDDASPQALALFGLSPGQLMRGATWLAESRAVVGTALQHRASADSEAPRRASGWLDLSPGPNGYAFALTEALAEPAVDEASYARRGLAHALEAAARTAARAVQSVSDARAVRLLEDLAGNAGPTLELCGRSSDETLRLRLSLPGAPDDAEAAYRLFEGEELSREISARRDGEPDAPTFDLRPDQLRATRFYLRDMVAAGHPIVAAIAHPTLDERGPDVCGRIPMDASLHAKLSAINTDESIPELKRLPRLPDVTADYTLTADMPTPVTWRRAVMVERASEVHAVDLAQPFGTGYARILDAARLDCPEGAAPRAATCAPGTADALQAQCAAHAIDHLVTAGGGELGPLRVLVDSAESSLALLLWSFELRKAQLVSAAAALERFECARADGSALEQRLWQSIQDASNGMFDRLSKLEPVLAESAVRAHQGLSGERRALAEARDISDSRLARARLLMSVPFGLYDAAGPASGDDALDHALDRFPVVVHPAILAEERRAEELLRHARVDPLLPAIIAGDRSLDLKRLATAYRENALASTLQSLRIADGTDESSYDGSTDIAVALGITKEQLNQAGARIVQSSELWGTGLLPSSEEPAGRALGIRTRYATPRAEHLFAVVEGRTGARATSQPTSFALRGPYHAVAYAVRAARSRAAHATDWTIEERTDHDLTIGRLAQRADDSVSLIIDHTTVPPSLSVELPARLASEVADPLEAVEIWWTDAGLRCAIEGQFAGEPCHAEELRFEPARRTRLLASNRLALEGFLLPKPSRWTPSRSLQSEQGRVYVTLRTSEGRRCIASAALDAERHGTRRVERPQAPALDAAITALLAPAVPSEGCGACTPRSICETTSCQQGLCVRAPLPFNRACGSTAACVAGTCSEQGCGDGAVQTNQSSGDAEACDDGNLEDGDGCSRQCKAEPRAVQPWVREVSRAGAGPAIASDGLGNALLIYMADELSEPTASLNAALFDAFGIKKKDPIALTLELPRGFGSAAAVAGLRDGGFVSVGLSHDLPAGADLAFRRIDEAGEASAPVSVDAPGNVKSAPRVAQHGDGFAVAWAEPSSAGTRLKLRRFDRAGVALTESKLVEPSMAGSTLSEVELVSSSDQLLVVWSHRNAEGTRLGIRGRRFDTTGSPVDATSFEIADGATGEPSATVLEDEDYLVAFTDQRTDPLGDIGARVVRRYGPPLSRTSPYSLVASTDAEQRPSIAAGDARVLVVAYRVGAPASVPGLYAEGIDAATLATARSASIGAEQGDVVLAATNRGLWLTWSERIEQSHGLFLLQLPRAASTTEAGVPASLRESQTPRLAE